MSVGFLPDLTIVRAIRFRFQTEAAHKSASILKFLQFARPTLSQIRVEIASAKSPSFIFIPTGMSPSISTILPLDTRPFQSL